jgi:hypothetical protein
VKRGRLATIGIALGVLGVAGALVATAAPLTPANILAPEGFFRLCPEAQRDIANLDDAALAAAGIKLGGTMWSSNADFIASKSAVSVTDPAILTSTYVSYRDAARTQPEQVRCKMRTGESLSQGAWPAGSANNPGRFAVEPYFGFGAAGVGLSTNPVDAPCSTVNQRTIDNVWQTLSPAQRAAAPYKPAPDGTTLVTVPDIVTGSGPEWLADFPAMQLSGGTLQVGSLALLAPTTAPGGVPRVVGAHYCTLVAPEYLRDVLTGQATVTP